MGFINRSDILRCRMGQTKKPCRACKGFGVIFFLFLVKTFWWAIKESNL